MHIFRWVAIALFFQGHKVTEPNYPYQSKIHVEARHVRDCLVNIYIFNIILYMHVCIYMSVCLCLFLCMCVHMRVSVMTQNHPNRPLIVSIFKKQSTAAWAGRICQLDASVPEPFLRRTYPALPNCHSTDRTWSLPLPLVYFCIHISFLSSCCQGFPPPSWS